jgi:hypothetical protein
MQTSYHITGDQITKVLVGHKVPAFTQTIKTTPLK